MNQKQGTSDRSSFRKKDGEEGITQKRRRKLDESKELSMKSIVDIVLTKHKLSEQQVKEEIVKNLFGEEKQVFREADILERVPNLFKEEKHVFREVDIHLQ